MNNTIEIPMVTDAEDEEDIFDKVVVPGKLELEPRPIFLQLGVMMSIKGSAYMEYGNTKVMVAIEPPRELTNQSRNTEDNCIIVCTANFLPSITEDSTSLAHKENMLAISLKKVLESSICTHKFCNVQLDVKVTVLEDDGCALSTAINCCGAALVVAGIPTYDIITASTICYYKNIEFVNPDANVENLFSPKNEKGKNDKDYGIVTTASFSSFRQVTGCFQRGMLSRSSFTRLVTHTMEINERLSQSLKQIYLENVQKVFGMESS